MAFLPWYGFVFLMQAAQVVLGNPNCPIYGAEFPKPTRLEDSAAWKDAMANLTSTLEYVAETAANYSFSVQVFSNNPGSPILFEKFHTAQNLPADTAGVTAVDADTVYRIGSVTKIFTVLTFLAEAGDKYFNHPITEFIPELASLSASRSGSADADLRTVDWEDINLLSLMTQMSGIERDYLILGEIVGAVDLSSAVDLGFPPLSQVPDCGDYPLCNRTQFFQGLANVYPSFAPWKTPAYSNIAFQLLSYALENITGRPFYVSLTEKVLEPLKLDKTFYFWANQSTGIIPRNVSDTSWNDYIGDESPSGNMFSSAGDLSKLGIAVLNSTLLKPVLTRRWLKPFSFPSDTVAAVGAPWGLRRLHLSSDNPHRSVTAFTKAGGIGDYSALLSIIPEFDIGITVMVAGADTAGVIWGLADYMGGVLLPGFDAATRDDAASRYGGTYRAANNSGGGVGNNGTTNSSGPYPFTNSSSPSPTPLDSMLTITSDPSRPGLGLSPWRSNGTDMIPVALALQSGLSVASDPAAANASQPSVRLYYTGLESGGSGAGALRQSFKAVFETLGSPSNDGSHFSTDCGIWIDYTGVTYAGLPLDEFIFESDGSGNVVSVTNLALNVTLYKV